MILVQWVGTHVMSLEELAASIQWHEEALNLAQMTQVLLVGVEWHEPA